MKKTKPDPGPFLPLPPNCFACGETMTPWPIKWPYEAYKEAGLAPVGWICEKCAVKC